MTDRPILFSGPMVRALLEGRKTQTRRVLKPQPPSSGHKLVGIYAPGLTAVFNPAGHGGDPDEDCRARVPFMPGDRLYVREAWRSWRWNDDLSPSAMPATWAQNPDQYVSYIADVDDVRMDGRFRQGMHMPRWASRLTLEVTDVRVQRLQEIEEADSLAEGVLPARWEGLTPRDNFRVLWDSLNAERGFGWEVNPWVVAVTFAVERQNIDQLQ